MISSTNPPIALTIAGFDTGGAVGLHADIKTFTALKVYTASALTVITAQDSADIHEVSWMKPDFLKRQLDVVLSDYGCKALKTGFIGKVSLIETIASIFPLLKHNNIIIDPVLVDDEGKSMFSVDVAEAYKKYLFPFALFITPNIHEATLLTGIVIKNLDDIKKVALELYKLGPKFVLIKRFIQEKTMAIDAIFDGTNFTFLKSPYLKTKNTHGSGDTLSAAITAHVAQGIKPIEAVRLAHGFTQRALNESQMWNISKSIGPVGHF